MISKFRKYPLRADRSILRQGKRLRGKNVEIFTLPSSFSRIGVIVGKNVSLKAAQRNLVKRRVAAALLQILNGKSLDVVVRALPSSREATYEQIENELNQLIATS